MTRPDTVVPLRPERRRDNDNEPGLPPRSSYRAQGGGWVGVGGTLAIYAVAAALLLLTITSSHFEVAPPAALTAISLSPPASPQATPPKPKDAPKPVEKHVTVPQPVPTIQPPVARITLNPQPVPPIAPSRPADPTPPAPEAAAPRTLPAPPAPRVSSNGPDSWEGRVLLQLSKVRHYPGFAMARGEQGVPYIRFTMDRKGKVLSVTLDRSSGFGDLDREALALPKRAQPLPKPPEDRPGDTFELVVPVEFFIH
jgi:periplasmic protein TonB